MNRRFLLSAAPALLLAKPALATSVCTLQAPYDLLDATPRVSEGVALYRLNGASVLVDTTTYELDGTVDAVVIGADGAMRIDRPKLYDGHMFAGARSGIGWKKRYNMGEGVVIIGRVVGCR